MFFPLTIHLLLALAPGSVVANLPTQILYQSPTGLFLENIAVRPSGKLLLTSVLSPTLHNLDTAAANATLDEVYTFPNATALTGITEYRPDVYAVVASELNVSTISAAPGSIAIWSVDFTSGAPIAKIAARIPRSTLTNGLSTASGRPDIVLAADSDLGAAYEIDMRTGAVRVLIQNAALAPGAPPPALGINGLHPHGGSLYFTNSALNTFGRVSLGGGAPEVLGSLPPAAGSGYDDFTFDAEGWAWVATHPGSVQLFYVLKNGTWVQETAAGNVTGSAVFQGPTSAAFGRCGGKEKILYVTTAGGQVVAVDTSSVKN
jgi:hypothetical protein